MLIAIGCRHGHDPGPPAEHPARFAALDPGDRRRAKHAAGPHAGVVRRPVPRQVSPPDHEPGGPARLGHAASRGAREGAPRGLARRRSSWRTSARRPAGCRRRCAPPPRLDRANSRSGRPSPAGSLTCSALLLAIQSDLRVPALLHRPQVRGDLQRLRRLAAAGHDRAHRERPMPHASTACSRAWMPPLEILLLLFLPFSFAGWVELRRPVLRPPAEADGTSP